VNRHLDYVADRPTRPDQTKPVPYTAVDVKVLLINKSTHQHPANGMYQIVYTGGAREQAGRPAARDLGRVEPHLDQRERELFVVEIENGAAAEINSSLSPRLASSPIRTNARSDFLFEYMVFVFSARQHYSRYAWSAKCYRQSARLSLKTGGSAKNG